MRWLALLILLPQLVSAKPNEMEPPRGAVSDGDGVMMIGQAGSGESPDETDEVTYRYDLFAERDPTQLTHEEKTRRITEGMQNDRLRGHLLKMKPGEIRWLWFSEQDGNLCDHFGCSGGPTPYAAKLELVSVTRHHDALPSDMHITAWPHLGVRQGKSWAAIPANRIEELDRVSVAGNLVTIDMIATRFPENRPASARVVITTGELLARLELARGIDMLGVRQHKAAKAAFERAIALAPSLDAPYLYRAAAQVGLHEKPTDVDIVTTRNPAGAYWHVMSDRLLAGLRAAPAIRALEVNTPGTFDVTAHYRCRDDCLALAVETTGRFILAYTSVFLSAEYGLSFGALRILDAKTGAVIETIPLDSGGPGDANDGTSRCARCTRMLAAQKMVRALGFSAPPHAKVSIEVLDPTYAWPSHPRVVFADAKLELARTGDRSKTTNQFIAIAPPPETKVVGAELVGDLVIYRWATMGSVTDVAAFRR